MAPGPRSHVRGRSQLIDTTWEDPQTFLANAAVNEPNDDFQSNYTTMSFPHQSPTGHDFNSSAISYGAWPQPPSCAPDDSQFSADYADPSSLSSTDMSRIPTHGSFSSVMPNNSLADSLNMLRVKSEASNMCPPISQTHDEVPLGVNHPYHQFVFDQDHSYSSAYSSLDSKADGFDFISASAGQQATIAQAAPSMLPEFSNSSSTEHPSMSRSQQRHQETLQQSQRSIAPARNHLSSSPRQRELNHQQLNGERMIRVTSETGEEKVLIPKNQDRQKRPAAPKLLCPHCSDHPDGFRGEHELQRHVSRAHNKIRKVWVCVDSSPDGTFLANCKACRTKKRYGAYYNAAAHLRRTHFNPRKKGRKAKGEEHEKRGGKGGGNWPPMEDLKESWMREIEEIVPDDESSLPDDDHDIAGEPDIDQFRNLASFDFSIESPIDQTTFDGTGAGFSPMSAGYSPGLRDPMTMNMSMDLPNLSFQETMFPQALGMIDTDDMLYGALPGFLPQQGLAFVQV